MSDDPLSQALQELERELLQELEWVTEERDQARRELLAYDAIHGKLSVVAAAKARGWGYLVKENKL